MICIIKLWKFIKGYVIIKISGFNINKLINKSLNNNINILDLQNNSKYYSGSIHINQLDSLNELAKKNNCKIEVISKSIVDVVLSNIKVKSVFILGILMFIVFIYFCSSIVWVIDIEGNKDISKDAIIQFCDKNKLYIGSPLKNINGKVLSENLKNTYKKISWVNISLNGTRVHIKLAEGTQIQNKSDNKSPCDIVSNVDGIISEIVTDSGTPIVKKNDVVTKGDILISGILKNSGNEEIIINDTVHSTGRIKAYVTKKYCFKMPFLQKEKIYTGNELNKYRIKLWGIDLADKSKVDYKQFDYTKSIKQLKISDKIPLPFTIYKYTYKEFVYKENIIDLKQAKDLSHKKIIKYIIENYPTTSDIVSCKIKYTQIKNELSVEADITSNDIIGEEQPIEQPGGNLLNDATKATNLM